MSDTACALEIHVACCTAATHRALQVVAARAGNLLALLKVDDVKHRHQVHVVRQPGLVARRAPRALDRVVVLRREQRMAQRSV